MEEEEKIWGYKKKTLTTGLMVLVVAGGMFYVGAKYEKNKLSKLGLLKNGTEQVSTKKAKTPVVVAVKFADQEYAKVAYLVSGDAPLSADAKTALAGFVMTKKTLADGTTEISLKAQKPEYHDQKYVLKTGEQLYFIDKFLQDDKNGAEANIGDDTGVVVDSLGNVVQAPTDWSK